jgi:2-polyprenyl-6-methoxyphenol hydroxylase-like FAD-dependent oxidoreductase
MGEHAVVIGGSITGLATAKVLSSRFTKVTVVERDHLPDDAEFRAGVPQGRQLHVLLRRGLDLLEGLFPGFGDELRQAGAEELLWGRDLRWYHFGGWKNPNQSALSSIFGSRLLMESVLRRRLRSDGKVAIREATKVDGLLGDGGRVTGLELDGGEKLEADLIVDASGRESKAVSWLEKLGQPRPAEQIVNANLGYSTRMYRRPPGFQPGWKALLVHATPPKHNRIGAILPAEGDRWQVVMCGVNGDYPPTDEQAFLEFAGSLPGGEFRPALERAEPLSSIYGYRRTANRLFRFDKLDTRLRRFVALGDAVCAFNPVYGQGMTTGTIGACLLGECLDKYSLDEVAGPFQKRLSKALTVPWFLATTEDFRYPETEGRAMNAGIATLQGAVDKVIRRSVVDQRAYDAFLSVMHMTRGLEALADPRVLFSMMRSAPPRDPAALGV